MFGGMDSGENKGGQRRKTNNLQGLECAGAECAPHNLLDFVDRNESEVKSLLLTLLTSMPRHKIDDFMKAYPKQVKELYTPRALRGCIGSPQSVEVVQISNNKFGSKVGVTIIGGPEDFRLDCTGTLPSFCTHIGALLPKGVTEITDPFMLIAAISKLSGDTFQSAISALHLLDGDVFLKSYRFDIDKTLKQHKAPSRYFKGVLLLDNKDKESYRTPSSIVTGIINYSNSVYRRQSHIFALFTYLIRGILAQRPNEKTQQLYDIINMIIDRELTEEEFSDYKQYISKLLDIKFEETSAELIICGIRVSLSDLHSNESLISYVNGILKKMFGPRYIELPYYKSGKVSILIRKNEYDSTFMLIYLSNGLRVLTRLSNYLYIQKLLFLGIKGHDLKYGGDRGTGRTGLLNFTPIRDSLEGMLGNTTHQSRQITIRKVFVRPGNYNAYVYGEVESPEDDYTRTCHLSSSAHPQDMTKALTDTGRRVIFDSGETCVDSDFLEENFVILKPQHTESGTIVGPLSPTFDQDGSRVIASRDSTFYLHKEIPKTIDCLINLSGVQINIMLGQYDNDDEVLISHTPKILPQEEIFVYGVRVICKDTNEVLSISCESSNYEEFKRCMLEESIYSDTSEHAIILPKTVRVMVEHFRLYFEECDTVKQFKTRMIETGQFEGSTFNLEKFIFENMQRLHDDHMQRENRPETYSDQINRLKASITIETPPFSCRFENTSPLQNEGLSCEGGICNEGGATLAFPGMPPNMGQAWGNEEVRSLLSGVQNDSGTLPSESGTMALKNSPDESQGELLTQSGFYDLNE